MAFPVPSAWLRFPVAILGVEVLGSASGILGAGAVGTWYQTLTRPPGVPPEWVFGVVWTVLYACMGVSLALLWGRLGRSPGAGEAVGWFLAQLVLNLAWTPLFFGLKRPGWALAEILLLLAAVICTIRAAWPVSRPAAWLLVPYLFWVCYAAYLNGGFFFLNR